MSRVTHVSAMPMGEGYFAVLHRAGEDDEIMDGPDGRPARHATAFAAVEAGKRAAGLAVASVPSIEAGIAAWRAQKRREAAEERARVFGGKVDEGSGR